MLINSDGIHEKMVDLIITVIGQNCQFKGDLIEGAPYPTNLEVLIETPHPLETMKRLPINDPSFRFIGLTCGFDHRFYGSLEDLTILLTQDEKKIISRINQLEQGSHQFHLQRFLYPLQRIVWTRKEIERGTKLIRGKSFRLTEQSPLIMHYYLIYENHPLRLDVILIFPGASRNPPDHYFEQLSRYTEEYYQLLSSLQIYFPKNSALYRLLRDVLEQKLGLMRQLLALTDAYHQLYDADQLDPSLAESIVDELIQDLENIPCQTSIRSKLENTKNLKYWDIILDVLAMELRNCLNRQSKKYYDRFFVVCSPEIAAWRRKSIK